MLDAWRDRAGSAAPGDAPSTEAPPDGAQPVGARWWLLLALLSALAVGHTLLVAPHYAFGSFDDDASYVEITRALLHGVGLTGRLPQGQPLAATYPPGYSALLAPLGWVTGGSVDAYRALSGLCYAALIPLTDLYLRRRGVSRPVRLTALALLALNPVAATFATMVMAEMPFLVALLALVLLLPRWDAGRRVFSWSGLGVLVLAAALVWLKEAAAGLVLGLVVWEALGRRWRHAAAVVVATGASLLPVLVARVLTHTPLLGSRYSTELGGYYAGGLLGRVVHVAPEALWQYVWLALPRSIAPVLIGQNPTGPVTDVLQVLTVLAAPLVVVGFVVAVRRHRDVAVVMVPVYVLESLGWPEVNERRVILILPFVLAWYALGLAACWRALARWRRPAAGRLRRAAAGGVPVLFAALLAAVLLVQLPRDYLYALGTSSSRPVGSGYMTLLAALGRPGDVVETDYLWTTSYLTGHRTADTAFFAGCTGAPPLAADLAADRPTYVLSAALNHSGVGSPCLLAELTADPDAVLLYASPTDLASVFELVGPATTRPRLRPVATGRPVATATATTRTLTWSWGSPAPVTQLSTGPLTAPGGLRGPRLQLRTAAGWTDVATRTGPAVVGGVSWLLATSGVPVRASALRLVVSATAAVAVGQPAVLAAG